MDVETFKAIIEHGGGEDKVIAITFDNAASESFTHTPYSHDKYLIENISCLKLSSHDINNRYFHVYKPLDSIQAIHFASEYSDRTRYDSQTSKG